MVIPFLNREGREEERGKKKETFTLRKPGS